MSLRGELLSVRVKEILLEHIREGRWKPGEQLPAENELAVMVGVSRLTLRSGLQALERDGVLVRKQGQGTFVAKRSHMLKSRIDDLQPVPVMIREFGFTPRMEMLQQEWVEPPQLVIDLLGFRPPGQMLLVSRVYFAGEEPAVYISDYFPAALLQGEISFDQFDGDMMRYMDSQFGVRLDHAIATMRAIIPPPEVRKALRLSRYQPVLSIDQVVCDLRGNALWVSLGYNLSDLIHFQAVRKRL